MYLVDTNVLIEGARRYPFAIFPGYWRELAHLSASGKILFHERVKDEIVKWDDEVSHWFKSEVDPASVLKTSNEEVLAYRELVVWVGSRTPKYKPGAVQEFLSVADSWLVASAKSRGLQIVTYEVGAPEGKKRVKIPDAADAFQVRCLDPVQMLLNEKVFVG